MRMKRMLAFLLMGILLLSCGCSANSSSFSLLNRKKTLELTEKGVSYWAQYLEQQEIGKPQDVVEQENHLSYLLQYPKIGKERIEARISEIVTEIRNAFDAEFTPTEEEKKEKKQTDAILYLGYESYLAKENQLSLVFFETHETNGELSPHTQIQVFHFDLEKDAEVTAEAMQSTALRKMLLPTRKNTSQRQSLIKTVSSATTKPCLHPTRDGLTALHSQRTAYCFISTATTFSPAATAWCA